jgi:hypothetical protein
MSTPSNGVTDFHVESQIAGRTAARGIRDSVMTKARVAGFFWLMTAVMGTLAMFGDNLVVWTSAATTAANIIAHEPAFRLANASNIIAGICYLIATIFVYELLKPVNPEVSLLAAFFSLGGIAMSGVSFLTRLAPLTVLGSTSPSAFTAEQLQSLALTFLRLNGTSFFISHIFFGLHCLLVGSLIFKSTFLPRVVGGLMVIAGLGWLTMSFSNLVWPPLGRSLYPFIILPGAIGEITLSFWLLIRGVNVQRWQEQGAQEVQ